MKKVTLIIGIMIFFFCSLILYGSTSIMGYSGNFTIPTTDTAQRGVLQIGSGYIFTPGNFYISLNTSFIDEWEFSMGKEIPTSEGEDLGSTPLILGTKYRFYGKGNKGFKAAVGGQLELLGQAAGVEGTPISIYGTISEDAGKLGYINTGLGYTFGINAGYRINFFFGFSKPLIGDKLFVIGEITNYSIRQGLNMPWNEERGIFNGGLILELTDFIKFKFIAFDLLDNFLTVGFGGEVEIKIF